MAKGFIIFEWEVLAAVVALPRFCTVGIDHL